MQTLFWNFLNISAKIIKIDPYNVEQCRFKFESFLRPSVCSICLSVRLTHSSTE